MTDIYTPPESTLEEDNGESPLASRWNRLFGAIIDGIISLLVAIPLMFLFGMWDAIKTGVEPPFMTTLGSAIVSFILFIAIHGHFLRVNGQTIGKKLVGTKIVGVDNAQADFNTVILKRYLPITAVSVVPIAGQFLPLIDVLFIFRGDKRCVHDLIAGTKVVNA